MCDRTGFTTLSHVIHERVAHGDEPGQGTELRPNIPDAHDDSNCLVVGIEGDLSSLKHARISCIS